MIFIVKTILQLILLLGCLIASIVYFNIQIRKHYITKNVVAHVCCEKCKTNYDVEATEFIKGGATKQVVITKTKVNDIMLDNTANFKYYTKKFKCPSCAKRAYAQVLNHEEIVRNMRPCLLKEAIKSLGLMFTGGIAVMIIMTIV